MPSKAAKATYDLSSTPSEEKAPIQHAETVEQTEGVEVPVKVEPAEGNIGLRIDGDDFDHQHEPKVVYLR